ncbi:hypothetical protein Pla22_38520 [Rubripirellula amarantea]|uniref:Uncharacterized protein n=2 Tax=Rubripirellula amarantea TaxID=2527999 RepID=A0A5C5WJX4_9BACT|nr:hypothetical protein Pla22_38520 [Rubripirellula amarantea]
MQLSHLLARNGALAESPEPKDAKPNERKVKPEMSRFLKHLTDPEVVRTIDPRHLLELLSPHQTYLSSRGFNLPAVPSASKLDYEKLIYILETPLIDAPQDLLNALGMINDMATEQGMDALLSAAQQASIALRLSGQTSPADVAVQVWLANPAMLEAQHTWHTFKMPRRMECFSPATDNDSPLLQLTSNRIEACRVNIGDWMDNHNRSSAAQLLLRETGETIVATVRRGDPFRRVETIDNHGIRAVHLRPAAKDTMTLCRRENIFQINSQLKSAREVYRRCFGDLMYGSPDHFIELPRYNFDAFVEHGFEMISPGDLDAIEYIALTEVRFRNGGSQNPYTIYGADDLIVDMEERGYEIALDDSIDSISLLFKFRDVRLQRAIKLYAGNAACYTRDEHAVLIEEWMKLKGFMLERSQVLGAAKDDGALAIA